MPLSRRWIMTGIVLLALSIVALLVVREARGHHHETTHRNRLTCNIDLSSYGVPNLSGTHAFVNEAVFESALQQEDACDGVTESPPGGFEECVGPPVRRGRSTTDPNNPWLTVATVDGQDATLGRFTGAASYMAWLKIGSNNYHQWYQTNSFSPAQAPGYNFQLRMDGSEYENPIFGDQDGLSSVWFEADPNNMPFWEIPLGHLDRDGDPNGNPTVVLSIVDPNFTTLAFGVDVTEDCLVENTCTDNDSDGVCDYDDNCSATFNPPIYPLGFQTVTAGGMVAESDPNYPNVGQLDDDADGQGNHCDGDFNNADNIVNPADLALFQAASGKKRNSTNCGGNPCDIYDLNGSDNLINAADLSRFLQLNGTKKQKAQWRFCCPVDEFCNASHDCQPGVPGFRCSGDACQ